MIPQAVQTYRSKKTMSNQLNVESSTWNTNLDRNVLPSIAVRWNDPESRDMGVDLGTPQNKFMEVQCDELIIAYPYIPLAYAGDQQNPNSPKLVPGSAELLGCHYYIFESKFVQSAADAVDGNGNRTGWGQGNNKVFYQYNYTTDQWETIHSSGLPGTGQSGGRVTFFAISSLADRNSYHYIGLSGNNNVRRALCNTTN